MLNLDDFTEEISTMQPHPQPQSQLTDGVKCLVPPIHPLDVEDSSKPIEEDVENISLVVVEETPALVVEEPFPAVVVVEETDILIESVKKEKVKPIIVNKKSKKKYVTFFNNSNIYNHQPEYQPSSNFKFNLNSTKKKSGIFSTMNIISR